MNDSDNPLESCFFSFSVCGIRQVSKNPLAWINQAGVFYKKLIDN